MRRLEVILWAVTAALVLWVVIVPPESAEPATRFETRDSAAATPAARPGAEHRLLGSSGDGGRAKPNGSEGIGRPPSHPD